MPEIFVHPVMLNKAITNLNNLKDEWASAQIAVPTLRGTGQVAATLMELAQIYVELNNKMAALAGSTALLLSRVENNFKEVDYTLGCAWDGSMATAAGGFEVSLS